MRSPLLTLGVGEVGVGGGEMGVLTPRPRHPLLHHLFLSRATPTTLTSSDAEDPPVIHLSSERKKITIRASPSRCIHSHPLLPFTFLPKLRLKRHHPITCIDEFAARGQARRGGHSPRASGNGSSRCRSPMPYPSPRTLAIPRLKRYPY
ncbi:hypothetical protein E2C01_069825 [Portunus trituberculatus]|uniref:Uncharacterized protein n=1 Tax=Portunus trituberculatus TaxID=210409 RepID=A0A5B7I3C9_PORTR|nr:hypothetical protein [Portunus trituberculatus]